eukprot:Hpha_TRINITY_DN16931_c1_g3::TRINITY_DN16931_c1_g3_i1::g.53439::m.53439
MQGKSAYKRPRTLNPAEGKQVLEHKVVDEKGVEHNLVDVWADRKVVVVFLRHLGCRFCKQLTAAAIKFRERVEEVKDRLTEDNQDTEVVIFSIGRSEDVAKWRSETGWKGELYLDPDPMSPATYRFFAFLRQEDLLGDQRVAEAAAAAGAEGYKDWPQPWTADIKQSGGLFVLGPGSVCDFAFRSEYAGHHPPMDYVFQIVTGLFPDGKPFDHPGTLAWNQALNTVDAAPVLPPPPASKQRNDLWVYGAVTAVVGVAVSQFQHTAFPRFDWKVGVLISVVIVLVSQLIIYLSQQSRRIRRSKLYTLGQVDRRSMELGIDDCDCGFIGGTEVEQEVEEDSPKKPKALVSAPQTASEIDEITTLLQLGCYVREFLAKPNFLVGRKGSTCPFIPTSLRRDTVYMVNAQVTADHTVDDVKRLVREYVDKFESLEPRSGTAALYRTIMICMPLVPLHLCRRYIDQVQLELKGEVLKKGMMIGENHLYNNGKGLHNEWYPLRTPHPCLALRHMVPGDLVFLGPDKYPLEVRRDFIGSFVRTFESPEGRKRVSEKQLAAAQADLAEIERQLKEQGKL